MAVEAIPLAVAAWEEDDDVARAGVAVVTAETDEEDVSVLRVPDANAIVAAAAASADDRK